MIAVMQEMRCRYTDVLGQDLDPLGAAVAFTSHLVQSRFNSCVQREIYSTPSEFLYDSVMRDISLGHYIANYDKIRKIYDEKVTILEKLL